MLLYHPCHEAGEAMLPSGDNRVFQHMLMLLLLDFRPRTKRMYIPLFSSTQAVRLNVLKLLAHCLSPRWWEKWGNHVPWWEWRKRTGKSRDRKNLSGVQLSPSSYFCSPATFLPFHLNICIKNSPFQLNLISWVFC